MLPVLWARGAGGRRKASSAESPRREQQPVWAGALGTTLSPGLGAVGAPHPDPCTQTQSFCFSLHRRCDWLKGVCRFKKLQSP